MRRLALLAIVAAGLPAGTAGGSNATFRGTVATIPPAMRATMTGVSWHAGCPVSLSQLRLLTLTYWGFDGRAHTGRLVVNADVARTVVSVFRRLYAARFPIRRMQPVDAYGGSDFRSIEADNTSAFNCRRGDRLDALVGARVRPRDRRRPDREPLRRGGTTSHAASRPVPRPLAAPARAWPIRAASLVEAFAAGRLGLGRQLVGERPRLPALLGERALELRR